MCLDVDGSEAREPNNPVAVVRNPLDIAIHKHHLAATTPATVGLGTGARQPIVVRDLAATMRRYVQDYGIGP